MTDHFAWSNRLIESIWSNVSDERFSQAMELAIERLEKRGEYREPTPVEVDSALEDLMTDPDYSAPDHSYRRTACV